MDVHKYACVYIHIYIYTYAHVHIHIHIKKYVCRYVSTAVCGICDHNVGHFDASAVAAVMEKRRCCKVLRRTYLYTMCVYRCMHMILSDI